MRFLCRRKVRRSTERLVGRREIKRDQPCAAAAFLWRASKGRLGLVGFGDRIACKPTCTKHVMRHSWGRARRIRASFTERLFESFLYCRVASRADFCHKSCGVQCQVPAVQPQMNKSAGDLQYKWLAMLEKGTVLRHARCRRVDAYFILLCATVGCINHTFLALFETYNVILLTSLDCFHSKTFLSLWDAEICR